MLFLLYINDLPQLVNNKSTTILFGDDTSILFTHVNTTEFNSNTHTVFETISTCLKNNYLSFKFKKKIILFTLRLGTIQPLTQRLVIIIN